MNNLVFSDLKRVTPTRGIRKMDAANYLDGAVTFTDIMSLGMDSYSVYDGVIHALGYNWRNMQGIFQSFAPNQTMQGYDTDKLIVYVGVEMLGVGQVRGTLTPPGAMYATVDIEIYSPGGGNGNWYSELHSLPGLSNRGFVVVAIGRSVNGYQRLTLKAVDGRQDLVVNALGEFEEFPANMFLSELGVLKKRGDCLNEYIVRDYNHTEMEFGLTKKADYFTVDRETLQQEIKAIDFFEMVLTKGGESRKIAAFIDRRRQHQSFITQQTYNAGLFYDRGSKDPNDGLVLFDGLKWQIPSEMTRTYMPSQLDYNFLNEIMRDFSINNPYLSDDLIVCAGSAAFQSIQQAFRFNNNVSYRTDPKMSFADASKPWYMGEVYAGMRTDLGKNLKLVKCPEFDTPWAMPRRSPSVTNAGIGTHDVFIIDPSANKNINVKTGNMEAAPGNKVQFWGRKNPNGSIDHIQNVWIANGLVDNKGNARQGEVQNLREQVQFYSQIMGGVALVDKTSVFYLTHP